MAFESNETLWFNPTDAAVKFSVFDMEDGKGVFKAVEIAPKAEVKIPSRFDRAIQHDVGGVVIGLAPQLVKGGKPAEPQTPKTEPTSPKKDK